MSICWDCLWHGCLFTTPASAPSLRRRLVKHGVASDKPLDNVVIQRMKNFAGMTKLKKVRCGRAANGGWAGWAGVRWTGAAPCESQPGLHSPEALSAAPTGASCSYGTGGSHVACITTVRQRVGLQSARALTSCRSAACRLPSWRLPSTSARTRSRGCGSCSSRLTRTVSVGAVPGKPALLKGAWSSARFRGCMLLLNRCPSTCRHPTVSFLPQEPKTLILPHAAAAGDGVVSLAELREGLERMGNALSESEILQVGAWASTTLQAPAAAKCQPTNVWLSLFVAMCGCTSWQLCARCTGCSRCRCTCACPLLGRLFCALLLQEPFAL